MYNNLTIESVFFCLWWLITSLDLDSEYSVQSEYIGRIAFAKASSSPPWGWWEEIKPIHAVNGSNGRALQHRGSLVVPSPRGSLANGRGTLQLAGNISWGGILDSEVPERVSN